MSEPLTRQQASVMVAAYRTGRLSPKPNTGPHRRLQQALKICAKPVKIVPMTREKTPKIEQQEAKKELLDKKLKMGGIKKRLHCICAEVHGILLRGNKEKVKSFIAGRRDGTVLPSLYLKSFKDKSLILEEHVFFLWLEQNNFKPPSPDSPAYNEMIEYCIKMLPA